MTRQEFIKKWGHCFDGDEIEKVREDLDELIRTNTPLGKSDCPACEGTGRTNNLLVKPGGFPQIIACPTCLGGGRINPKTHAKP